MQPRPEAPSMKTEVFAFGGRDPLPKAKELPFNKSFNDPTANVVFKTSDNVLFKVHDYHLKANR